MFVQSDHMSGGTGYSGGRTFGQVRSSCQVASCGVNCAETMFNKLSSSWILTAIPSKPGGMPAGCAVELMLYMCLFKGFYVLEMAFASVSYPRCTLVFRDNRSERSNGMRISVNLRSRMTGLALSYLICRGFYPRV